MWWTTDSLKWQTSQTAHISCDSLLIVNNFSCLDNDDFTSVKNDFESKFSMSIDLFPCVLTVWVLPGAIINHPACLELIGHTQYDWIAQEKYIVINELSDYIYYSYVTITHVFANANMLMRVQRMPQCSINITIKANESQLPHPMTSIFVAIPTH